VARQFGRAQILERLRHETDTGRPIVVFGAGIGLTARCAELGGADVIGIYAGAFWRMDGMPALMAWLPYADSNAELQRRAGSVLHAVRHTPCVAGVGAHDPRHELASLLDRTLELGFSGVTNEPYVGMYGIAFAAELEAEGLGFSRELQLVALARERGVFTIGWVTTPDEASRMAEAGADVVGAVVGVTTGGVSGANVHLDLAHAAERAQAMFGAARARNPEAIMLVHGGPFADPETAEYALRHTDAVGYAAGSSGERIPTEAAVVKTTRQFKEMSWQQAIPPLAPTAENDVGVVHPPRRQ
jgi:predicted TIM-barrel enzyme